MIERDMMSDRELDVSPRMQPIVLRSPPSWTSAILFGVLAVLHWCVCIPAFSHGRVEGYMSLIFATIFTTVAITLCFLRSMITIEPARREIHLRSGFAWMRLSRVIPFQDVHAVRLTMSAPPDYPISRIEVLCDNEDIECPPALVAREEALCLAILMGVQLIKVHANNGPQMSRF